MDASHRKKDKRKGTLQGWTIHSIAVNDQRTSREAVATSRDKREDEESEFWFWQENKINGE